MRTFRTGRFDRGRLPGYLRRICPNRAVAEVGDIDPSQLRNAGKKLVLLDVDNTLTAWHGEDVPAASSNWIAGLKAAGLRTCVLSNTRRPERLRRITERLGIDFILGRFKPSPRMYHQALEQYGVRPEEAVMVGDQLFTDVWGANRAGIEAIWVKPIALKEFVGTKVSRLAESMVRGSLYRVLEERA